MHVDTDSMERACVQAEAEAAASIGSLRGKFVGLVEQLRASERRCDTLMNEKRGGMQLRDTVLEILSAAPGDDEAGNVKAAVALTEIRAKLLAAVEVFDTVEGKKKGE